LTKPHVRDIFATVFGNEEPAMAKCEWTGKRARKAHNVSHANNKTRRWQHPNVQSKRIWVEEWGKYVRLSLSTRAIRTITRVGLLEFARKKGIDLSTLVER